jgi:hypothetical protein
MRTLDIPKYPLKKLAKNLKDPLWTFNYCASITG